MYYERSRAIYVESYPRYTVEQKNASHKQQATCVHTDVRALHLCIDTSRKGSEGCVAGSVGRAHHP